MIEAAKIVCGARRVGEGGGRNKGKSEWWCDEVEVAVRRKRECYERWLQSEKEEDWLKYKRVSREAKVLIRKKKKRAGNEWGKKVARKFRENKISILQGSEHLKKGKM